MTSTPFEKKFFHALLIWPVRPLRSYATVSCASDFSYNSVRLLIVDERENRLSAFGVSRTHCVAHRRLRFFSVAIVNRITLHLRILFAVKKMRTGLKFTYITPAAEPL